METTLHNHRKTSKDGKPLIPNIVYKSLLHLLFVKDYEACDYIIQNYSLTEYQRNFYDTKRTLQRRTQIQL